MWTSEPVASVLGPDTLAAWSRGLQSQCPVPTSLGTECEEGHRWQGASLWFSYTAGVHTQQSGSARSVEGCASLLSCSASVQCVLVPLFLTIPSCALSVPSTLLGPWGEPKIRFHLTELSARQRTSLAGDECVIQIQLKTKQNQNPWAPPPHSPRRCGPLWSLGTQLATLGSHALRA